MTTQENEKVPPCEELVRLYVTEGLSLKKTGEMLGGAPTSQVTRWLYHYGLRPRTVSEARYVAKKHVYSEETLARMRERAAVMRTKIDDDARARHAAALKGRVAPNKGSKWSPETRAKMAKLWEDDERRKRFSEARMGEKSSLWKGGVKSELNRRLDHAFWRRRRQEVYARDNWTCTECGIKCRNSADAKHDGKTKIQAHHIISRRNGGSDDLDNLRTVCMSCHHKIERREGAVRSNE